MKKILQLLIITILVLFVVLPAKGYAKTYSYSCSDGGMINTLADIDPVGPFAVGVKPTFNALGQITSTCNTKQVSLTAENKPSATSIVTFEPLATLISPTTLNYGETIPFPLKAQTIFTAPAVAGNYVIHFSTGVDDNVMPQISSVGLVMESQNFSALGGTTGTPYTDGFNFTLGGVCLSDVAPQDEVVKVAWTSSNGQRYNYFFTVLAGDKCAPATGLPFIIMSGPKTGTAGPTSNVCARAEDPNIHVGPGVTECPPNQPWVMFYATPGSVKEGDSSTLTWTSMYADSCISPDFDTGGATSGSVSTGPLVGNFSQVNASTTAYTADYTITCTGAGGTTSSTFTINICHIQPDGQCVF